MNKFIVYIIVFFLCISCTVQKTIYYDTQSIPQNFEKPAVKKSICILTFNDIRKEVAGNDLYLQKPKEIFENKQSFCINSEEHYKKNPLGVQMAWMLAKHMIQRGTFKSVVVDNKDSADYVIECNLARITGKQHLPQVVRNAPTVGGVIGGVIVMGVKSKAFVSIAITDVKIYDKSGKLVVDMGSFSKDYEEELHPDAGCWCSYDNVKNKLKNFYSEFVFQIENRIEEL